MNRYWGKYCLPPGAVGLLILISLSGCVSLSSLQSPQVLEPKQQSHGFALAGFYDHEQNKLELYEIDVYGRFGIAKHWDLGYKIYGIPFWFAGIQQDIKYQILDKSVKIAGDIGISYTRVEREINVFGFYPMLLVGTERFYAGVKAVYFTSSGGIEFFGSFRSQTLSSLVFGVIIGKKQQIVPEINIYFFPQGETAILPGIGFQIRR
jgi:hypothetical protein